MSQLITDTTIKGHGLRFDVRSYKLFRSIDFSLADLKGDVKNEDTTVSTYYEIGDLPPGFVPRNVALVELVKPPVAESETGAKVGVYLVASTTPGFESAETVKLTSLVIEANKTTNLDVKAADVKAALKANALENALFIKVKLVEE